MGETLVVRRLDGKVDAVASGKAALLGEPSGLASVVVLAYKPSPGGPMSHTDKELKTGERKRKRFMKRVKRKYRLGERTALPAGAEFNLWLVGSDALRASYLCGKSPSTELELRGKTLALDAVEPDRITRVVRIWTTDDPQSFVVKLEPARTEAWKNCMPPKEKEFGPPPRATFRRITF